MATTGALRIVFWVLLALCSHPIYVRAQSISFTNIDYTVTAGSPFAISWYGNGDVGCSLLTALNIYSSRCMAIMLTPHLAGNHIPHEWAIKQPAKSC